MCLLRPITPPLPPLSWVGLPHEACLVLWPYNCTQQQHSGEVTLSHLTYKMTRMVLQTTLLNRHSDGQTDICTDRHTGTENRNEVELSPQVQPAGVAEAC